MDGLAANRKFRRRLIRLLDGTNTLAAYCGAFGSVFLAFTAPNIIAGLGYFFGTTVATIMVCGIIALQIERYHEAVRLRERLERVAPLAAQDARVVPLRRG